LWNSPKSFPREKKSKKKSWERKKKSLMIKRRTKRPSEFLRGKGNDGEEQVWNNSGKKKKKKNVGEMVKNWRKKNSAAWRGWLKPRADKKKKKSG